MSIELKITGDTPNMFINAMQSLAVLFAPPTVTAGYPATWPGTGEKAVSPSEAAEPVAEPVKARGRPRKAQTIEHDPNEGGKADVHADAATAAATSDASERGDGADAVGTGAAGGAADPATADGGAEAPAGSGAAAAPSLTAEQLREFIIAKHLNANFQTQPERSAEFRAILDHFKLEMLKVAKPEQIDEIKAFVDERIASVASA